MTYNGSYDMDLWTEVAKHLASWLVTLVVTRWELVMLSLTNRWFNRLISEEYIWEYACLRDMEVPAPRHVSWRSIHLLLVLILT
jgi:hypothetical protein